jgi:thymidine kinase
MRLDVILGPMFAGKSSAVIARVRRARALGWKTLLLTSALDTRYGNVGNVGDVRDVITHDRDRVSAVGVKGLMTCLGTPEYEEARLIIIEEAQFFVDLVAFVLHAVEKSGKDVVVVGLDGDSDRRPFGSLLELVPLADTVTKLTALCKRCGDGTEALFSAAFAGTAKPQVHVGGEESYEPLCRRHYLGRIGASGDQG